MLGSTTRQGTPEKAVNQGTGMLNGSYKSTFKDLYRRIDLGSRYSVQLSSDTILVGGVSLGTNTESMSG